MALTPRRPFPDLRGLLLCGTALAAAAPALAQAPNARPQGGVVSGGSATIAQDAARTQVNQATDRAVIDWRGFDVGRDHAVRFQQPNSGSMTLNRVNSADPSRIAGQVTANGGIAIVNPSGVIFAPGARVEAQSVIVSTADIANQRFMAGGRMVFDRPGRADARIVNEGSITAREAGIAALVAPQVANRGVISARLGTVAIAGAETHVIDLHGDGLMSIEITSPVRQRPADGGALVSNDGVLQADGGRVSLTAAAADGIVQNLVRAGGRVSANTDAATGRRGEVVVAGTGGAVIIEGHMEARGIGAGQRGGTIEVVADRVLAASGARIDASGSAGGGEIAFGQTRQGSAAPRRAERTGVAAGAELRADATVLGQGGRVVLHSTDTTLMAGTISAHGGPQGGDGGFVEVSGERGFRMLGSIDVSAPAGRSGTVLFDPDNLRISDTPGTDDPITAGDLVDNILEFTEPLSVTNAVITPAQIAAVTGDLILQATTSITVENAVTKPQGSLTLQTGPDGLLTINAGADIVISNGNLTLISQQIVINALASASGTVTLQAPLGGSFTGSVVASGAGRIVAQTLTRDPTGNTFVDIVLNGDNIIGTVADLQSTGSVSLRNTTSLLVTGPVGGGNDVTIEVTNGNLVVTGTGSVAGGTTVAIGAVGDITVDGPVTGQNVRIVGGGTITVNAPLSSTGDMLLAAGTDYTLANPFGTIMGDTLASLQINAALTADVSMSLQAGAGGIHQIEAVPFTTPIRTQTLRVYSTGNVELEGGPFVGDLPNEVATLGPSVVNGLLALSAVAPGSSTAPLSLSGDIDVLALSLTVPTGVTQLAGSRIFSGAGSSSVSITATGGDILLTGDNRIGVLNPMTALDDIDVRSTGPMFVGGPVTRTGVSTGSIVVQVDGNLTVIGAVDATVGTYALTATGNVTIATGASVTSTNAGQVASVIGAGILNGSPIAGSAATLTLAGNVSVPGALALASGTGGIVQTGGSVSTGRLVLAPGGNVLLDGGTNAIASLAAVDVPGALRIVNGSTDITIGEAVTAQVIEITTQGLLTLQPAFTAGPFGSLTAGERIALRVGGLSMPVGFTPGVVVTAPVIEIAPAIAGPMQVALSEVASPIPGALVLTDVMLGRMAATDTLRFGATTISGTTATTATSLEISGNFDFAGGPTLEVGRLDLRSLGDITQVNGTLLGADILTGQAGGAVTLPNVSLGYLDDLSAGGDIVLSIGSLLRLRGLLTTPGTATLSTPNGIETTGTGRAVLGELRVNAVEGNVLLTGQNAIDGLGESDIFGDLVLVNTGPSLTIPSGSLVDVGGSGTVTATAGSVTVDGTIRASELSLSAPAGTVTVNGFSAIAFAGGLALSGQIVTVNGLIAGTSGITVDASQAASLAGIAQTPSLSITSPSISFGGLDASGSAVALFLGAGGSASGTLAAASLRVTDGAGAVLTGSIAGDTTGTAAALGRRFAGATQLGDPPPNQLDYLFNDCPIGASVCTRPPPPPLLPPTEPPVTPPTGSPFSFDIPAYTVADNPRGVVGELDPAGQPPANPLVQIPILPFVTQPGRDTSEDRELAPPNIRAEDF